MWQSIMKLIVIWIKEILILIFLLWLLAYIEWLDNSFAMNNGSFCLAYCNIMQIDQVQQQYKLCYSFSLHWACAETENVKFRDERIRLLWDTNFLTALPLKAYAEAGWLVRFSTFSQNSMVCKFCLPFVVQAELSSCFQHQSAKLVQLTYKHNESYTSLMAPNTDCKSEHTCASVNISAELTLSCLQDDYWKVCSCSQVKKHKWQRGGLLKCTKTLGEGNVLIYLCCLRKYDFAQFQKIHPEMNRRK